MPRVTTSLMTPEQADCYRARRRAAYKANPEKQKAYNRKYRRTHRFIAVRIDTAEEAA